VDFGGEGAGCCQWLFGTDVEKEGGYALDWEGSMASVFAKTVLDCFAASGKLSIAKLVS